MQTLPNQLLDTHADARVSQEKRPFSARKRTEESPSNCPKTRRLCPGRGAPVFYFSTLCSRQPDSEAADLGMWGQIQAPVVVPVPAPGSMTGVPMAVGCSPGR